MQRLISQSTEHFILFISSGDDALSHRDLVDDLVRDAINSELLTAGLPIVVTVDRWERTAPGRTEGETINDWFVRRARRSSVALCLLVDRLGQGTKEELEAVLASEGVELSVIWFVDRTTWPDTPVGEFLKSHEQRLFIDRAGSPEGPGALIALCASCST